MINLQFDVNYLLYRKFSRKFIVLFTIVGIDFKEQV